MTGEVASHSEQTRIHRRRTRTAEERLARLDHACGCTHGAVAALSAAVLGGVFLAPARWHHDGPVLAVLEVLALVVLASGLGKLVGLRWAHREAARLRRLLGAHGRPSAPTV